MTSMVLPSYQHSTLADLMPSIAWHLTDGSAGRSLLPVKNANSYVVVMVDGLGYDLLCSHRDRAPFLASLLDSSDVITSGVPSTTAASLTSLGTGLPPGIHGTVGYSFRYDDDVFNALVWADGVDPHQFQPHDTWFEILEQAGIPVWTVSIAGFATSGLTLSGLRGSRFVGVIDEQAVDHRLDLIAQACSQSPRSLVYTYERRLDHVGHSQGCSSAQWSATLDQIDEWIERLFDQMAEESCLIVTGDHGMVDVPKDRMIMIEDHHELVTDLSLIAGEGRLRQLYTSHPRQVASRWADFMADRAVVLTADEAIAQGWFGPIDGERVRSRLGDVLVAMDDNWATMTWSRPGELTLVGQHGSLTHAEMCVPLVIAYKG